MCKYRLCYHSLFSCIFMMHSVTLVSSLIQIFFVVCSRGLHNQVGGTPGGTQEFPTSFAEVVSTKTSLRIRAKFLASVMALAGCVTTPSGVHLGN